VHLIYLRERLEQKYMSLYMPREQMLRIISPLADFGSSRQTRSFLSLARRKRNSRTHIRAHIRAKKISGFVPRRGRPGDKFLRNFDRRRGAREKVGSSKISPANPRRLGALNRAEGSHVARGLIHEEKFKNRPDQSIVPFPGLANSRRSSRAWQSGHASGSRPRRVFSHARARRRKASRWGSIATTL